LKARRAVFLREIAKLELDLTKFDLSHALLTAKLQKLLKIL
jgi:hypothetical protein